MLMKGGLALSEGGGVDVDSEEVCGGCAVVGGAEEVAGAAGGVEDF